MISSGYRGAHRWLFDISWHEQIDVLHKQKLYTCYTGVPSQVWIKVIHFGTSYNEIHSVDIDFVSCLEM